MKKFLLLLCLVFVTPIFHGCGTPPSERVAAVQTLKAVGASAEATVALSAHLYANGVITAAQARTIMNAYDSSFQPAFRLAVQAAKSDLSSPASADIQTLASQLAQLLSSYTNQSR